MANENVIFRRGPSASIPEQKVPGTVLIETDTGNAFVDDTTTSRVQLTDTRLSVRIDDAISTYGYIENGVLTGDLNASSHSINNLPTPSANGDAANKQYVDTAFTTLESELGTTLAGYLPLKGGTMTGILSLGNYKITEVGTPQADTDATNKTYVDDAVQTLSSQINNSLANYLLLSGGTMTGAINMGNFKITSVATPTDTSDATNKQYVDSAISSAPYLNTSGATPMAGNLNMATNKVTNLGTPTDASDAVTKSYVDNINTSITTSYLPLAGGNMTGAISMGGSKITATYTPSTNNDLTNKEYVDTSISEAIAASDAMVFKGTIGTSGTVTQLPTSGYRTGWTYRVVTAGTYAGKTCEIGDMLIALNDGPGSGSAVINADWADVQANISGAVITPNNLTTNQLIVGNNGQTEIKTLAAGSNGQVLKISNGVPTWGTDNNTTYTNMTGASASAAGTSGLVPAPKAGNQTMYLRGDGTWAAPPQGVSSLTDLGVTATATELNYMDGVTSNVQTQLNAKQATITGGASTIASTNLTASRALVSNGSGKVVVSNVTSTELGYLDGVTSSIQTQLNAKSPTNHASSATTYGVATTTNYGHVKVTTGGLALSSGTLSHATGAGYKHLPSGGSATQVLIGTSTSGQGQWTNTIPPEVIIDDGVVS